jgi:hypothetical protein
MIGESWAAFSPLDHQFGCSPRLLTMSEMAAAPGPDTVPRGTPGQQEIPSMSAKASPASAMARSQARTASSNGSTLGLR